MFRIAVTTGFLVLVIVLFLVFGAEILNTTKTFTISNITKIELTDGNNGNTVEITDQNQIQSLVRPFNDNEFKRGKSSANYSGWSYRLSFYQGNTMTTQIIVNSTERIDFEGRFYDIKDGSIDVEHYKELLSINTESSKPESAEADEPSFIGAWSYDTGSITHLNEDGTGKTVDDDGEHEFTWENISLKDAMERRDGIRIREYIRVVYGEKHAGDFGEPDWGENDFLLMLTFDDFPFPLDFPYTMEDQDTLTINTMQLGQILSPTPNISIRLEWIALTRVN